MADEIRLLGPDGKPVRKRDLTHEVGRPTLTGVRQVSRHESIASGLTPRRLAAVLRAAAEGDYQHYDYLTLAEEMEERDPHYAAVLGVRKRAVSGIEPAVEAASADAKDVELADAVRELVRRADFSALLEDSLDALGKGFSAVEIIWDRSASLWQPARYELRDPRFFVFDREDGRTLRLLDEADILKLITAVANLGTDAAAVLPESMRVEFIEAGSRQGGDQLFDRLASYLDKQVSKAVLGQTMTSDDGSSRAQAQVHDAVRGDILQSDARQLENTLNRDLVRPFIDLNYGPQESYPRFQIPVKEPEDITALATVLEKLVPLGLRVEASVIRDKLGLPDPDDDAELLQSAASPAEPPEPQQAANRYSSRAVNRATTGELEALTDDAAEDWEPQLSPLLKAIREYAARSGSYEEFQRGLAALLAELDSSVFAERLALAAFQARGVGDAKD